MKALISLCFLALALVCHATPYRRQPSSLSSLEELPTQLNRRQQLDMMQALNDYPLLSSLELQKLRRLLSTLDVNSRENPTPQVHTRPSDFGLG